MNGLIAFLVEKIARHPGRIFGSILGFILGWMIVTIGFFKTLFVVICLIVGYYIGAWFDAGTSNQSEFGHPFRRRNLR